jgi:hypothetical protein
MIPTNTLFLFSTNSWLAFVIAEEYYEGSHFAWVSPIFDTSMIPERRMTTPPTSTPKEIYLSLLEEVSRGDRHSAKIAQIRRGILRGAEIKHQRSEISDKALMEIKQVVSATEIWDYRPLLYVIAYPQVKDLVSAVPIKKRAHPLSQEYVIESLPNSCFEALNLA